jgi:hypothetical protein
MRKRQLRVEAGFAIGIFSLVSLLVLPPLQMLFPTKDPTTRDHVTKGLGFNEPLCLIEFHDTDRRVRLHHSFLLKATARNFTSGECPMQITVSATAFDVKPETKLIRIQPLSKQDVYFSVLPNQPGEQSIITSSNITGMLFGEEHTWFFNVYEYPFIPPNISVWFPILGTLSGGLLTIPWWIEWLTKRKEKKKEQEEKARNEREAAAGDV